MNRICLTTASYFHVTYARFMGMVGFATGK